MSESLSFVYPDLPPSEWSRNSRSHWAVLHRIQDQMSDDVYMLLLEAGWKPGAPWEHAEVAVTFVLPDRKRRDGDNLQTSMKPMFDALVTNGILKDDDLSCIGFPSYSWVYEKGISETRITITERRE